jgi:hypothetical protein
MQDKVDELADGDVTGMIAQTIHELPDGIFLLLSLISNLLNCGRSASLP